VAEFYPFDRSVKVLESLRSRDDRLYRTISQVLNVELSSLSEESSPDTIGSWDSLNHLNLVMAIESEFGISLTAEDVLDIRNVALIRAILRERGAQL
jgi:acyl carrier protein